MGLSFLNGFNQSDSSKNNRKKTRGRNFNMVKGSDGKMHKQFVRKPEAKENKSHPWMSSL